MEKIALAGCVILKENSILLIHRIKKDWYELPGGKVNESESPEQAAVRELREELLCDVEILKRIGMTDFEYEGRSFVYHWFLARIKNSQTPKIGEPEEYSHFKYIPIKELSKLKLSLNVKNLMEELNKF